jgi:hypothetical protein
MKKYLIILLAMVVLLLVIAYAKLFSKQTSYHKTISASTSSVLILDNFDRTKIKIITADTDEIKVDLAGSAEDILSILQSESGIYTEFDFSGEGSDVSGTIIVPEGMLIDVSLSEKRDVSIDDAGGKKTIGGENSFLVDTNTLNSLQVDNSGNISLDAWGDLVVWDDESWDSLDEGNGEGVQEDFIYCGIGSQAIRNYCCETENEGEDTPLCNGIGHWIFDNSARACGYVCEESEPEEELNVDCGIGGQAERNICCANQHVGEYQGCMGSWRYNNASQSCEFRCDVFDEDDEEPEADPEGGGGETVSYDDPVSNYCVTITNEEDRDLCCNDTLKNNLSSGPRPGFPDCIGSWKFDFQLGCDFECAEHAEMMEILNEIKQQVQN